MRQRVFKKKKGHAECYVAFFLPLALGDTPLGVWAEVRGESSYESCGPWTIGPVGRKSITIWGRVCTAAGLNW